MNHAPKIRPEELENQFYQIKGTIADTTQLMFVDFQYSTSSVFTKTAKLNPLVFDENISIDRIKYELNKEFIKIITDLGKKNRVNAPKSNIGIQLTKFDIVIRDIKRSIIQNGKEVDNYNIARKIIAKINSLATYIAVDGRIGPGQFLISNKKTYFYISDYLNELGFLFNEKNQLKIGNIDFVVDESVDDDIILIGRKNSIDQPGVHCLILVDNDGYIQFQEYQTLDMKTKFAINYAIIDVGFYPDKQYFTINTRDLAYYRNLKLQRIKNLYGS